MAHQLLGRLLAFGAALPQRVGRSSAFLHVLPSLPLIVRWLSEIIITERIKVPIFCETCLGCTY